jgi:hypothetical protein
MMANIIRVFLVIVIPYFLMAQDIEQKPVLSPDSDLISVVPDAALRSLPINTPCDGLSGTQATDKTSWIVQFRPLQRHRHFGPETTELKVSKTDRKLAQLNGKDPEEAQSRSDNTPVVGTSFEANWSLFSTPPDNAMAISNEGFIVTANNDGVEYWNSSGSFLQLILWENFVNNPALTGSLYDPRVIFDSQANRFVMVLLHGSTPTSSRVLVFFSKSQNPQDGWWQYTLTGNPLNDSSWFDYPSLGYSTNEVYITGNLFSSSGSFKQAVIYQIPKAAGYAGGNLNWQYWHSLDNQPFHGFSLVVASFGHTGSYGPGVYLLSGRSQGDTRLLVWDLTDDMSGNPSIQKYVVNVPAYEIGGEVPQSGTSVLLDNGDCRMQHAFYSGQTLQGVFTTSDAQGWNRIYYYRIAMPALTATTRHFGLAGLDYCYPSIAPFSTTTADPSVMIGFLRCSPSTFPQVRVVHVDKDMNFGSSSLVQAGSTFVNFLQSSGVARWGDYTDMGRRHNSPTPRVWLAGCYGANIPSQNLNNTWKTRVAEISLSGTTSLEPTVDKNAFELFPNPVRDLVYVQFDVETRQELAIELWDINGRPLHLLYRDVPRTGPHLLSFNKGALPAGVYIVTFKIDHQIVQHEKIVVSD